MSMSAVHNVANVEGPVRFWHAALVTQGNSRSVLNLAISEVGSRLLEFPCRSLLDLEAVI